MSSPGFTSPKPMLPRLLMADDHHLILDALGAMMKNDFDVMAVDSCQAFMGALEEFRPSLAILDVNMPGLDGFATARRIREMQPNLPIVFLSMYTDPSYSAQAAKLGAKAYLSKSIAAHELLSALQAVLGGTSLLPAPEEGTPHPADSGDDKSGLTLRQREVLRLIAMGHSAKDIANALNISVRTAEFHRAAIMQRLNMRSTAQMTRYAIANNIN